MISYNFFITKLIFFLLSICLSSCKTQQLIYDRNNNDVSFIVRKESFEIPEDSFESPIYKFSFYLDSKKNIKNLKNISLSGITQDDRYKFEDIINFEKKIKSISEVIKQKIKVPFFLIENESGQFKYFFNFRKFKTPIKTEYFNQPVSIIGPVRSIKFILTVGSYSKKHINLKRDKEFYIGDTYIYQYDLKINPSDKKVRLHYISKKYIISSNWIDISEKTERLDRLFEY